MPIIHSNSLASEILRFAHTLYLLYNMILRINIEFCLKRQQPIGLCQSV